MDTTAAFARAWNCALDGGKAISTMPAGMQCPLTGSSGRYDTIIICPLDIQFVVLNRPHRIGVRWVFRGPQFNDNDDSL